MKQTGTHPFIVLVAFFFFLFTPFETFANKVATPVFNVQSGKYHHPITVTIDYATPGATIYYTIDGTLPDTASTIYRNIPILVANHASGDTLTGTADNDPAPMDSSFALTLSSMTIKAIAMKSGMENSDVASETYVIDLVDGTFNIPYADPPPADGGKHLLDVYQPHGRRNTPVLLFIHGGAWRQGDKNMYLELGNTFAGYYNATTVIASYQLSCDPWNAKHPTHVKDVAMAFRWVHDHIAEYGGDASDISVFGQSAGGHLLSLLATDSTYLDSLGLRVSSIKRVISMSGAYNLYDLVKWPLNPLGLGAQDVLMYKSLCENTFDSWEKSVLDAASPSSFVNPNQPPFYLITLEETDTFQDMPGFPKEAENFYNRILALNGPYAQLDLLHQNDIPPEILALDFPGGRNGHSQEIYAINTRNWDSRSSKMVASYLNLLPEVPVLLSPPAGATNLPKNVTFQWQARKMATYYRLQVSAGGIFDSHNIIFDALIGDTTWTVQGLSLNSEYFWRVQAISAAGESDFTSPQNFFSSNPTKVTEETHLQPHKWHLAMYPNPFRGGVHLTVRAPWPRETGTMAIYDLTGRKVLVRSISLRSGENTFSWKPDKSIASGVYVVYFNLNGVQLRGQVLLLK